jgi:hypothetical protein
MQPPFRRALSGSQGRRPVRPGCPHQGLAADPQLDAAGAARLVEAVRAASIFDDGGYTVARVKAEMARAGLPMRLN